MFDTSIQSNQMILLLGCTASGKSSASIPLARALGAEVLSVDSMQVYRRMDIGTAKASDETRRLVPHHMIDVAEPSESFSVARFVEMADAAIGEVTGRGGRVLATAGTPLYLMGLMYGMFDGPSADEAFRADLRQRAERDGVPALHEELIRVDPNAAARIHPNDLKRIERGLEVFHLTGIPLSTQQGQWAAGVMRYPALVVGIRRDREELSRRINVRVHEMMDAGLLRETKQLLAEPGGLGTQARQALGYAQMIDYLEKRASLEEAVEKIKVLTRQFAKHQRTWFHKFPMTRWVDVAGDEPGEGIAERVLAVVGE
ncbi:MAG: tRNA (adenosine(37)-N6)-dimethylallyltransferase MiaA [Planctomycetes bacterium]|nr:tRNA (adenosine(37)-N6)-dimethylallyltransferase MiaA [Planctomycetota bacterium]